jgi:hypothetical protein
MKTLLITILSAAVLSGCGGNYKQIHYMSRTEVSEAIKYCEAQRQRPSVTTTQVWFSGGWTDVPVNVVCFPR